MYKEENRINSVETCLGMSHLGMSIFGCPVKYLRRSNIVYLHESN